MKSKKSIIPKLIFFVVVSVAVVTITLSLGDINEIFSTIKNASPLWMFATLIALFVYIFLNQLPLYVIGKGDISDLKFSDTFLIGTTEYFFNGITPFASGGQPFQVYAFSQVGVRPSKSTGILLLNYVCYQIAVVILCIFSLFYFPQIHKTVPGLKIMVIIGITINVLVLLVFFGLGTSKFARAMLEIIVNWFLSWKIFKGRFEKQKQTFSNYCIDVQDSFKHMLKYKGRFTVSLLLKLLSMIIYFSIPFFILRALHLSVSITKIPFICAMTTFAVAMTCFIPTPGASGGIELAFNSLFASIAGVGALSVPGMILWRVFTYYFLMVFSFIIYLCFIKHKNKGAKILESMEAKAEEPDNEA